MRILIIILLIAQGVTAQTDFETIIKINPDSIPEEYLKKYRVSYDEFNNTTNIYTDRAGLFVNSTIYPSFFIDSNVLFFRLSINNKSSRALFFQNAIIKIGEESLDINLENSRRTVALGSVYESAVYIVDKKTYEFLSLIKSKKTEIKIKIYGLYGNRERKLSNGEVNQLIKALTLYNKLKTL